MAKAKKPSLLDSIKQLPKARGGAKTYRDRLTPDQLTEFDEMIEYLKGITDRPRLADLRNTLRETFNVPISERTLREYING